MLKSKLNLVVALAVLSGAVAGAVAQTVLPVTKEQEAKLLAVLKSDAPRKEKADACRLLALVGTKDAVPVLGGLLGDEELSHMARYALEPIPEPAVDEALRAALGSVKGRHLVGVINSLGVRRDFNAVAPIAALLSNADAEVSRAAARALGSIGTPTAVVALEKALPNTPPGSVLDVCEGLFRCAETLLAQGQHQPAAAIYDRLRNLEGAPHQVRGGALRGAILARQQDGVDLLRESLRHRDYILFSAAAQTALELPGKEVTEVLAGELGSLGEDHAVLVIQTLGKRGEASALPALVGAAKTGPTAVRLAAIEAMPMLRGSAGAGTLAALLADGDGEIAKAAQASLAAIPGKETDAIVMEMLAAGGKAQKLAAIELIERRWMTGAVPALMKATVDAEGQVRSAALRRIGSMGGAGDLPALLEVFVGQSEPGDLDAAEQALGALAGKEADKDACAAKLNAAVAKAAPAQKAVLLRVYSVVGGPVALKAVRAAVEDSDAGIRGAAIRALGAWKTADAAADLLELAKTTGNATDKTLCLRSYLGLASNPDIPDAQRLKMCRDAAGLVERAEEKRMLLSALGKVYAPGAVEQIVPHLSDPATKEEAVVAVVSVADKLLNRKDANKLAAALVGPLEKAAEATGNEEMGKRAKAMAEQARSKSS